MAVPVRGFFGTASPLSIGGPHVRRREGVEQSVAEIAARPHETAITSSEINAKIDNKSLHHPAQGWRFLCGRFLVPGPSRDYDGFRQNCPGTVAFQSIEFALP